MTSGINSRQFQVAKWLEKRGFDGEYLFVSTKLDSIYYRRLISLPPKKKLLVDLYTPILLEKELTLSKYKPQDWLTRWRNKQMVLKFLKRGSHFLVANRRQREYWVKTSGDLGVKLEKNDISVLPTGSSLIRKKEEGKRKEARNVVLWFGGIYPWMYPEPLIEAFGEICRLYPKWKLRILGGWQPQTGYKSRYQKIIDRAHQIIPNSQLQIVGWQEIGSLGKFLKDVAFAIHLVKKSPEDYFSHRVRLLTLLNYGIPIATSGKDVISDLLVKTGAGIRVDNIHEMGEVLSKQLMSKTLASVDRKKIRQVESLYIQQETDIQYLQKLL